MRKTLPLINRVRLQTTKMIVVAGVASLLPGCGATPRQDEGMLDARFAGPCDRIRIAWPTHSGPSPTLRSPLQPRTGNVEFHVVACPGATRRQPPLRYAYLAVPVDADSVPLVVTGIPDDAWWAMTGLWADDPTAGVLSTMGYEVEPAKVCLDLERDGSLVRVRAAVIAGTGTLEFSALAPGAAQPGSERRALITDDVQAVSAFFGPESGLQAPLQSIDLVSTELLGVADQRGVPTAATLDQNLTSNRLFWWLPKP